MVGWADLPTQQVHVLCVVHHRKCAYVPLQQVEYDCSDRAVHTLSGRRVSLLAATVSLLCPLSCADSGRIYLMAALFDCAVCSVCVHRDIFLSIFLCPYVGKITKCSRSFWKQNVPDWTTSESVSTLLCTTFHLWSSHICKPYHFWYTPSGKRRQCVL